MNYCSQPWLLRKSYSYNFAKRLKRLEGLTPYEFICTEWRKSPTIFHRDPADLTPGLYS